MKFTILDGPGREVQSFDYLDMAGSWAHGNLDGPWTVQDEDGVIRLTHKSYRPLRPVAPKGLDPLTGRPRK